MIDLHHTITSIRAARETGVAMSYVSTKSMTPRVARFAKGMTARLTAVALAAATTLTPLAGVVSTQVGANGAVAMISIAPGEGGQNRRVNLGLNKSMVVDLPEDAHDILVANPTVADAVTRTARRIYLFGKLVGQTNIFIFDGKGDQIAALDIRIERDIAGLEEMLSRYIPGSDIRAEMVNDNVVLTGTAPNALDSARAVSLAEIYVNGGEELPTTNTNTFFFGGQEDSRVVNLIKIDGVDQVQLRVTVAEIQRSVVKQLGIGTSVTSSLAEGVTDGFNFSVVGRGAITQNPLFNPTNAFGITSGLNAIQSQLQALEQAGVSRTLAEPNLTAISGEEANFKVGGEFSVPTNITCGEDGGVEFERTEYGINLAFTPVVLSAGRISLKIHTEVNEPTPQAAQPG
ncbi:MAG: pilus assembly protein N-terminal domain-containing protein, partial [Pseudomonadota bacterium]